MKVMGIDEAGRGCVLGPLIVGAFVADEAVADDLRALGITDSKKLSAKKRVRLHGELPALGQLDHEVISAKAIDGGNLNHLEEAAIVRLIQRHRPDHVVLDALGHPSSFEGTLQRLRDALGDDAPTFLMEPKADLNHAPCGAASIVAKVTRDATLAQLQLDQEPFGSGYPSDPVTRGWLAQFAQAGAPWPAFVRTRWGTVRDLEAR